MSTMLSDSGVFKAMTDPSLAFADAFSLFSQSATQAFSDLQTQTRAEVTRAEADARQARSERDKAVNKLQECQKETRQYKEQLSEYKIALKEAEITIRHHLESITHLQRETSQWKSQAKNWQEHFLRVEQERCSLTSKMDELVTERLIPSNADPKSHSNTLRPPTYQPTAMPGTIFDDTLPSESPTLPRSTKTSKYKATAVPRRSELPPYSATAQTPQSTKRSAATSGSASRGGHHHHKATAAAPTPPETPANPQQQQQPRQVLIRKVHAVVEVKQEEHSDEDLSEQPPESPEDAEPAPTPRRLRRSRQIINDDDDDDYDYESNDVSPEFGSSGPGEEEEAEDDELMIGAGDDLSFGVPDAQASPTRQQVPTTRTVANKRRKLNATGSNRPRAKRKT